MYIITLQQALETVAQCKVTLKYTVSQEKQDTELLPITSPNINQFSKKNSLTVSVVNLQQIHVKYSTTP